ncbi:hypothetical protein VPH35_011112 [Triticum aestivum]
MPDDARPGPVAREGGEPDAPPSARDPVILDTSQQIPRAATLSPLPPHTATLSQRRYQRINPESVPVPNGSGSGSGSSTTRKLTEHAPSPTPSMDERDGATAVDADNSCLASYLARASLKQRWPGGRPASSSAVIVSDHPLHNTSVHSSQGLNLGGGLYDLAAQASEVSNSLGGAVYTFDTQASQVYNSLDGGLYNLAAQATQGADLGAGRLYNLAAQATQGTNPGGGSSSSRIAIAAPKDPIPLKWGHKKRSRARREPHALAPAPTPAPVPVPTPAPAPVPTPTPATEPQLIPAQAHCRAILRLKKRPAAQGQAQPRAEAEKLMPPPSACGPVILDTSPHTPRAATVSPLPPHAATISPLPSRATTLSQHRSSAEDPHAAAGEQQKVADKAPRTTEQEPAPKVHEPKPPQQQQRRQPYHQAADKAAHASNGEQEPRQQPPRQASMKEKGKAPMVQEPPAVARHVAQRAAAATVAAVAWPPVPFIATQLTRREKEKDWFAITGGRLPYRPQQCRPKAVEDKLQKLFPGQTLPEVRQKKQKKRAGLQAMAEEDDLSSKRHDDDDNDAAGEKDHLGVAVAEERGSRRKRG